MRHVIYDGTPHGFVVGVGLQLAESQIEKYKFNSPAVVHLSSESFMGAYNFCSAIRTYKKKGIDEMIYMIFLRSLLKIGRFFLSAQPNSLY